MVHIERFIVLRSMQVLDGVSQNHYTIIISIRSIFQLKTYVCNVYVCVQSACMDVMLAYVCSG